MRTDRDDRAAGPYELGKPRFTSGRECWVFSVPAPEDLPGHHPELMGGALAPGEAVHHLLYSPLYEAAGGMFGVRGAPGSHALAVTPDRFVVSRDPHRDGVPRSVRVIPFDRVLWPELGHALLLGWLTLRFAEDGRLLTETVFFPTSGMRHFQAAVRAYRSQEVDGLLPSDHDALWAEACTACPPYLRNELPPLAVGQERPLVVLQSSERWDVPRRGRRPRPRCVSPTAIGILTERGLLLAESERPLQPGRLAFGVNATVVERNAIRGCRVETRPGNEAVGARLQLEVHANGASGPLEVPFDPEWAPQAERIVEALGSRAGTAS